MFSGHNWYVVLLTAVVNLFWKHSICLWASLQVPDQLTSLDEWKFFQKFFGYFFMLVENFCFMSLHFVILIASILLFYLEISPLRVLLLTYLLSKWHRQLVTCITKQNVFIYLELSGRFSLSVSNSWFHICDYSINCLL